MKRTIISLVGLLTIIMCSCSSNSVYEDSRVLPESGWDKDNAEVFDFQIDDANATYQILINVRHTNSYKSQNLWLFTETLLNDKELGKDTVECYLANNAGEWLGSGFGSLHEMAILYQPNIKFAKPGAYKLKIKHGMRENTLSGITDIGVEVIKK
ncbi:MAG: gliding motility lipoprotein GldH [Paludibacteraceae bacterium]|nr:gliding motility lipoprotein GldH [Paludibacteraceae bacterium]MBO7337789.1 gliding motility lipoprotein GldH [Paludibacteraceae bacterium]MBP5742625.1 gliding motility lipoprotein GldH [Paludibacteraceae bacterium]